MMSLTYDLFAQCCFLAVNHKQFVVSISSKTYAMLPFSNQDILIRSFRRPVSSVFFTSVHQILLQKCHALEVWSHINI